MTQKIGSLLGAAATPPGQKVKDSHRRAWVPQFARFKLQFIKRDGQPSTPYHSYDMHRGKGGVSVTDELLGLSKLLLLVERRRVSEGYVCATIWANLSDDLRTYIDGRANMLYDHIIFKHVYGQNVFKHHLLKFDAGRLDARPMLLHIAGGGRGK